MRGVLFAVAVGVLAGDPAGGGAQVVDLDIAYNQTLTSVAEFRAPRGMRVGFTANRLLGRVGLQVSYRHLNRYAGEIPDYCGDSSCTPGPFDESEFLNTTSVAITLNVVRTIFVDTNVGFFTSFSTQGQHLVNLDTGEETRHNSVGPDMGFGVLGDIRFPPIAFGIHPVLSGRYERIGASDCVADGPCLGGRHVGSVGIGLALRFR